MIKEKNLLWKWILMKPKEWVNEQGRNKTKRHETIDDIELDNIANMSNKIFHILMSISIVQ